MSSFLEGDLKVLPDELDDTALLEEPLEAVEDDAGTETEDWEIQTSDALEVPGATLHTVPVSEVEPERVEWLWEDRIPLGAVTLLAGDPGLGKSLLACDLAARLSRGDLTDGPERTLLITAEDGIAATVRPRLEAAGADLDLVRVPRGLEQAPIKLPDDVALIARSVELFDAKLVVFDPFTAHLANGVNSWNDQSIRTTLAPLHALAEQQRLAILIIAHLNKGDTQDPQRRIGGSIGLPAAARSVLLLARDPEDPEGGHGQRRILAHVKSNLSRLATSQLYQVESSETPSGTTPLLRLLGDSDYEGADLLVQQHRESRSALAEAVEFLQAELQPGPKSAADLYAAAEAVNIAVQTLKRAKKELCVNSVKQGFTEGWHWQLPAAAESPADD